MFKSGILLTATQKVTSTDTEKTGQKVKFDDTDGFILSFHLYKICNILHQNIFYKCS
jgi:hypothetical protein